MNAPAQEALVRQYWGSVWGQADFEAIDEVFADLVVRHNRSGSKIVTRQQLKSDLAQYFRSIPNAQPVVHDISVSGPLAWSRVTVFGVGEEERVVVSFLHLARFAEGRIAETWSLAAPDVDWSEPITQSHRP